MRTAIPPAPAVCALLVPLLAALSPAGGAAQVPEAPVPLFDGRTLEGWVVENSEAGNFRVEDGALRVGEPEGWLRFERPFADFELSLEFRFVTEGADSGVFLRAASVDGFVRGWPGSSYQVQLRDLHQPSNFLPLAHLYRHGMPAGETLHDEAAVESLYRGVGEWHLLEIDALGDRLVVRLEGVEVLRATGIANAQGYLGFQGEIGTVEYRAIHVRKLP